jgi:hypothetical protein
MPIDVAALIACSAASLAANGVLLREPLNPADPELPQHTVLPCLSVMVMIVLLNEAKMCICPEDRVRFTLRALLVRLVERTF